MALRDLIPWNNGSRNRPFSAANPAIRCLRFIAR